MSGSAYGDLGVSSSKEAVRAATANNDRGLFPHAFCKINRMCNMPGWVEVMHADGAGTKSSLAYIYWRETGDMSVWAGVVQDSIVMNLDDVACVGGMSGYLSLASSIDRNTFRIPDEVVAALVGGENKFLSKMRGYGIDIVGQCGETADVPDLTPTVVVNNTMHCRMELANVIDNGRIRGGDKIVGLASFGRAKFEDEYNGGMRSNGLTLARHGVLSSEYRAKYSESFHGDLGEKAYRGMKKLTDPITVETGEQIPAGKLILSPTRAYAPVVRAMYDAGLGPGEISGMVHNSGGGHTKILNYLSKPLAVIKDNLFDAPPLFEMIQAEARVEWSEMYRDFNMGCGLEIYVRCAAHAERIIKIADSFGIAARIVGRVERVSGGESVVSVRAAQGNFDYSR